MQSSHALAVVPITDQLLQNPDFNLVTQVHGGGKLHLRSTDSKYLDLVDQWWSVLLPRIAPYLYQNGGPILMVQASISSGALCLHIFSADFSCLRASLPVQFPADHQA